MRTYLLAVFFLPLLFAPQEPGSWKEGSNPLPDTSSRKSKGDFGAMMIITDRYNEFLQEWARPETPQIHPSPGTVHRSDTVVAVIVFTGCKAVATKCNSTVDLRVFKPDGSLYGEHVGQVLWDGSPPTAHRLQLS